jgi:hypothetical protein
MSALVPSPEVRHAAGTLEAGHSACATRRIGTSQCIRGIAYRCVLRVALLRQFLKCLTSEVGRGRPPYRIFPGEGPRLPGSLASPSSPARPHGRRTWPHARCAGWRALWADVHRERIGSRCFRPDDHRWVLRFPGGRRTSFAKLQGRRHARCVRAPDPLPAHATAGTSRPSSFSPTSKTISTWHLQARSSSTR